MGQLLKQRMKSDFFPSHYEYALNQITQITEVNAIFSELKERERGSNFDFVLMMVSNRGFLTSFRIVAFGYIAEIMKKRCALVLEADIQVAESIINQKVRQGDNVLIITDANTEKFLPKIESFLQKENPKRFISVLSLVG